MASYSRNITKGNNNDLGSMGSKVSDEDPYSSRFSDNKVKYLLSNPPLNFA